MRTKDSEKMMTILNFINDYKCANGISPTSREIAQQLDIPKSTVSRYLSSLRDEGKIVLNCITIQTLSSCLEYMRKHKNIYKYEAIQVQVNRLEQIGPYDMAKAINPIYIVTCEKISGRNN